MELWDAYDVNCNLIDGVTLTRGEPVPEGMRHLVCDILVRHVDGTYLLMKRDPGKQAGGMWEATAGGSALRGEGPMECAVRELSEETGIMSTKLSEVGRVVSRDTIYVEYLCVTDWDKRGITLQEGETVDFRWVSRGELMKMGADEMVTERIQGFIEELRS